MIKVPAELAAWRDEFPIKTGPNPIHRTVLVSGAGTVLYEWRGGDRSVSHFDSVPAAIAAVASGTLALQPSRPARRSQRAQRADSESFRGVGAV